MAVRDQVQIALFGVALLAMVPLNVQTLYDAEEGEQSYSLWMLTDGGGDHVWLTQIASMGAFVLLAQIAMLAFGTACGIGIWMGIRRLKGEPEESAARWAPAAWLFAFVSFLLAELGIHGYHDAKHLDDMNRNQLNVHGGEGDVGLFLALLALAADSLMVFRQSSPSSGATRWNRIRSNVAIALGFISALWVLGATAFPAVLLENLNGQIEFEAHLWGYSADNGPQNWIMEPAVALGASMVVLGAIGGGWGAVATLMRPRTFMIPAGFWLLAAGLFTLIGATIFTINSWEFGTEVAGRDTQNVNTHLMELATIGSFLMLASASLAAQSKHIEQTEEGVMPALPTFES